MKIEVNKSKMSNTETHREGERKRTVCECSLYVWNPSNVNGEKRRGSTFTEDKDWLKSLVQKFRISSTAKYKCIHVYM